MMLHRPHQCNQGPSHAQLPGMQADKAAAASRSPCERLPVQLLARVMQFVGLHTRLQTCAQVCSAWHEAAVAATDSIQLYDELSDEHADALSKWLAAHGSKAQISSIRITLWASSRISLVLPVQQLTALRDLQLWEMDVAAVDSSGNAAPLFGSAALTSLTSLELHEVNVRLQGLRFCTGLQRLDISVSTIDGYFHAEKGSLSEAIPQLQHLTSLTLKGDMCHDSVLAHVSCLARLQQLSLRDGGCTASFSRLPSSLTFLWLDLDCEDPAQQLVLSPSTTPGLCALSGLRALQLRASGCHVAVLSGLTQLTHIELSTTPLITTTGGPTLRALAALSQLQYLRVAELGRNPAVAPTAADYSALTASSQLTKLVLSGTNCGVQPALFPAGRQLQQLLELHVVPELLAASAHSMSSACPALQRLTVEVAGHWAAVGIGAQQWANSLAALSALRALTVLEFHHVESLSFGRAAWGAIAKLSGLRRLAVQYVDESSAVGLLQLAALQQLTRLQLGSLVHDRLRTFDIPSTALWGSPPDVWRQVPRLAWDAAADCLEELQQHDEPQRSLLQALREALEHGMQQQSQLQERVCSLEAQLAASEQQQQERVRALEQQLAASQQQQQRVGVLEQQVAALCAELAAVRKRIG